MITGEINGSGVVDLINYCAKKGMTGKLYFESASIFGEIHLARWAVVGAKTTNFEGDKAFEEIIALDKAIYRFEESSHLLANVTMTIDNAYEISKNTVKKLKLRPYDIIVQSHNIKQKTLFDMDVERSMSLVGKGAFYCQLLAGMGKRTSETNDLLDSMLSMKFIEIYSPKIINDVFLFPRNASMLLTETEKWLFTQIYEGMGLTELIEKTILSPQDLSDRLTWLFVKRVLTISDCTGKVLEPFAIRADLNLSIENQHSKLLVRMDRSFGNKTGSVRVDTQQLAFWSQMLFKKPVPAIKIQSFDSPRVYSVEPYRNVPGYLFMSQNDMQMLRIEEMDDLECYPLANPL